MINYFNLYNRALCGVFGWNELHSRSCLVNENIKRVCEREQNSHFFLFLRN